MGKRPTPPPLARWSGALRRVRLGLSYHQAQLLEGLLEQAARPTLGQPLDTPAAVGRRAGEALAAELLLKLRNRYFEPNRDVSWFVRLSEAYSLLAWLLSSPDTNDAAHPLRPLLSALHQLLS